MLIRVVAGWRGDGCGGVSLSLDVEGCAWAMVNYRLARGSNVDLQCTMWNCDDIHRRGY